MLLSALIQAAHRFHSRLLLGVVNAKVLPVRRQFAESTECPIKLTMHPLSARQHWHHCRQSHYPAFYR